MFLSLLKIFWKLHKFVHIKKLSTGLHRGHFSLLPFLFQFHALEVGSVYSMHSSNTLASWCEELTHWKRPWCWERLRTGGEGGHRGWDGWMASLDSMDMSLSKLWESVGQGSLACAVYGAANFQTWLSNWTTATIYLYRLLYVHLLKKQQVCAYTHGAYFIFLRWIYN